MKNSEQHRRDCEARHVIKMNDDDRQEYYKGALKHRSRAKVGELVDDVNRMRRQIREAEKEMTI